MNEEHDEIALDDITIDDVVVGDTLDEITDGLDLPDADEALEEEPEQEEDNMLEDLEPDSEDEGEEDEEEYQEDEDEGEDEEYEDDESGEPTVVSEVLEKLGYELEDEYEDTPEGLTKMTKAVASRMADDQLDEVLQNFPLVKQHLEYVLQGGESQKFMSAHDPRADYATFELNEDDSASQKAILANYFELKGHDKEFTNELLEDYEDSGKLFKKAAAAKEALGKYQATERERMFEVQKEEQQKVFQEQKQFWDGISDTINEAQEFAGVSIPEKEKGKFFNYISQPVNNEGLTQRDLDHKDAEMDVKLAIDYLMYKGFNLDEIINRKATTKSAQTLRSKISSRQDTVKNAKRAKRRSKSINVDDLDLSF